MNREKSLFLIVLVIALGWGALELVDVYEPPNQGRVPPGRDLGEDPPAPERHESLKPDELLMQLLARNVDAGRDRLGLRAGRSITVPHSDLLPVEPADIPPPRALPTPVVLPPVSPFPAVPWYRKFRADAVSGITGGPEERVEEGEEEEAAPDFGAEEEEEGLDPGKVLESAKKWEFKPEEYDALDLGFGLKWYGRISLTDEGKKKGHTKYDLLVPANAELPFYFEQINTRTGKSSSSSTTTLAGSKVISVIFADTIENRYWSRRAEERVKPGAKAGLLGLGRWVMELAGREGYDRLKGLSLAAQSFSEALAAEPGDLEATLALGEAYHRAFKYNEELDLYLKALAEKEAPDLFVRKARVLTKFGLHTPAEEALTKALFLAPGDTRARLQRGLARIRRAIETELEGRDAILESSIEDLVEVGSTGTFEEQAAAREGRARALVLLSRPLLASDLLAGAEDADSLNTLGAALYAQRKFAEALDAFRRAASADPDHHRAATNVGLALAQTATDWQGIQEAVQTLTNARTMHPLNYYWPPLGLGFAEQRRGDPVQRPDRYTLSVEHYLTARTALPTEPYVHYILGVSYLRDGRPEEARKEFLEALSRDYRFVDALIGVGTASLELAQGHEPGAAHGDWAMARSHLSRALQVEPDSILVRYRLGRALVLSEDMPEGTRFRQAKEHFNEILERDSRNAASRNALAYIAYRMGDVDTALTEFSRALQMATQDPDDPDRIAAEDGKQRIVDTLSRRLWVDKFERPNSGQVGNRWSQTTAGTLIPRIRDGKAVLSGTQRSNDPIFLCRGDKDLNQQFISLESRVKLRAQDAVDFRMMVYTRTGGGAADYSSVVGIEKNARGEVNLLWRSQKDKDFVRKRAVGEDGRPIPWPDDWTTLRIERTDHKKGDFALYLDGVKLGMLEDMIRRRPGRLEMGFMWQSTLGEEHATEIDEVIVERYE